MTTNKFFIWLLSILLFATAAMPLSSCGKDDDTPEKPEKSKTDVPEDDPASKTETNTGTDTTITPATDTTAVTPAIPNIEARITDTVVYAKTHMTAYNFVYAFTDPYGKPVTLSGAITIGDEIKDKHARGIILYNRPVAVTPNECPSRGGIKVQNGLVSSELITVSADYYGFGATADKPIAYCMTNANARASIDALRAAQKLLAENGFTWNNTLFNLGYSQGGQIAIGVLKITTEEYPDIRFKRTIAGGGSYDVAETYKQLIMSGTTTLPITVPCTLQSFNDLFNLGIDYKDIFTEPLLSDFNDCRNTEGRYDFDKLEKKMKSGKIADILTPAALDLESSLSRELLAAMEKENLCGGWTPRSDETITIFHNEYDDAVPIVNADKLVDFLQSSGLTITDDENAQEGVCFIKAKSKASFLSAHEICVFQFVGITARQLGKAIGLDGWLPDASLVSSLLL